MKVYVISGLLPNVLIELNPDVLRGNFTPQTRRSEHTP